MKQLEILKKFIPCCARPIVIQVTHFVGEHLHAFWWQTERVINDIVACWRNRSLTYGLTY